MSKLIVSDLILHHLPIKQRKTRSGISFNCPMCVVVGEPRPDTRMRGGIKIEPDGSFLYNCFNCKFSTRHEAGGYLSKNCRLFLKTIGVPENQIPIELLFLQYGQKIGRTEDNNEAIDIEGTIDFEETSLPRGSRSFIDHAESGTEDADFFEVLSYVNDRGPMILNNWQYYWTPNNWKSLNKRFIIPFYYKKKIVGWTARYASNRVPPSLSKYYSETPTDYMFNMDLLNSEQESIILVEGVIDAIAIDGVAVLGNRLSDRQVSMLKRSGKKIIVVPDRNESGDKLVEQAIKCGFSVSVPERSSQVDDIASAVKRFGVLYILEKIYENVISDPEEIKIKYKLLRL